MRLTIIERTLVAAALGLMAIAFAGGPPAAPPVVDSRAALVIEEIDCPFAPSIL
jgi:hypothetical protein